MYQAAFFIGDDCVGSFLFLFCPLLNLVTMLNLECLFFICF